MRNLITVLTLSCCLSSSFLIAAVSNDYEKQYPLHAAIKKLNYEEVKSLLELKQYDVNAHDSEAQRPLDVFIDAVLKKHDFTTFEQDYPFSKKTFASSFQVFICVFDMIWKISQSNQTIDANSPTNTSDCSETQTDQKSCVSQEKQPLLSESEMATCIPQDLSLQVLGDIKKASLYMPNTIYSLTSSSIELMFYGTDLDNNQVHLIRNLLLSYGAKTTHAHWSYRWSQNKDKEGVVGIRLFGDFIGLIVSCFFEPTALVGNVLALTPLPQAQADFIANRIPRSVVHTYSLFYAPLVKLIAMKLLVDTGATINLITNNILTYQELEHL